MPPSCSICSRPDRAEIDQALVEGVSLRAIEAKHTGTNRSSIDRHRKHIPTALAQARQASEVAEATSLLSRVERLTSRCERFLDRAEESGEYSEIASAFRELRGYLELLGKVSGELRPAGIQIGQVNIQSAFQNVSVRELTDQQLEDLFSILKPGRLPQACRRATLMDETTVAPPENIEIWRRSDESINESRRLHGAPERDWQPHRPASIPARHRMLLAAWERLTGQAIAFPAAELGPTATIEIEFDLSDPREEWWHTWPVVRLITGGPTNLPENEPPALPQTIEGA